MLKVVALQFRLKKPLFRVREVYFHLLSVFMILHQRGNLGVIDSVPILRKREWFYIGLTPKYLRKS